MVKAAHRRCGLAVAAVAALHLLAATPLALAIEQTGDIAVTVRSEDGAALPGVALSISGPSLLGERSGLTDADGRFTFRALPPGSYVLDCSREGRIRIQIDRIIVDVGTTSPVPVTLPTGALEETVTVTAKAPLIDVTRTTSQETYEREHLDNAVIGLESRYYQNMLDSGASIVSINALGTGVELPQIRGAEYANNLTLLDGVDVGDPIYSWAGNAVLPFDAMEQVQVQTGAFPAEFGRSTGGVVNVVTRSGGNAFSGTVDLRYGDEGLVSSGDHFDREDLTYTRGSAEATLGGPIVKDKLWFFAAYGHNRLEDAPPDAPVTGDLRRDSGLAKLTWQVAPSHKVALEYVGNWATKDNSNAALLMTPEAAGAWQRDASIWTAQYQGILGRNLVLQAQAGTFHAVSNDRSQSGDATTRCAVNLLTGLWTRNYCTLAESDRDRDVAMASVIWSRGRHGLKAGVDLQRTSNYQFTSYNGGGLDVLAPDANGVETVIHAQDVVSPEDSTSRAELGGYYVQDEWKLHSRLTANLGVRYSTYRFFNDAGDSVWRNDIWEPRLGVAWDVTGDAVNVVKASASRFGMASTLITLQYMNSQSMVINYYWNETIAGYFFGLGPTPVDINGDGTISARLYTNSSGGTAFQSFVEGGEVKIPHVDELSVSYERRLGAQSALGVTYVRRRGRDLIESYADPAGTGLYFLDNLPGLETQYDAVEAQYRGQWKGFHLRGSYVWSESQGNIAYGTLVWRTGEYDFPAVSGEDRWGWLPGDTRNAVKLNGWWTLPKGFQIGYSGVYYSGFPWTPVQQTLAGLVFPEGRGSRRLPAYKQLDLEFSKRFPIKDTDLRLFVTVINVFNSESVIAVTTNIPYEGRPTDFQDTRRIQLGLHYSF